MCDVSSFPYRLLGEEPIVGSVANGTRQAAREFLALAPKVPLKTHVQLSDLADSNRALADLRVGRFHDAAVVKL
jgi:alcohol dehydrogenase, propanol-preferring